MLYNSVSVWNYTCNTATWFGMLILTQLAWSTHNQGTQILCTLNCRLELLLQNSCTTHSAMHVSDSEITFNWSYSAPHHYFCTIHSTMHVSDSEITFYCRLHCTHSPRNSMHIIIQGSKLRWTVWLHILACLDIRKMKAVKTFINALLVSKMYFRNSKIVSNFVFRTLPQLTYCDALLHWLQIQ